MMILPYLSLVAERSADLAAKLGPAKTTVQVLPASSCLLEMAGTVMHSISDQVTRGAWSLQGYFGLNDTGTPLMVRQVPV